MSSISSITELNRTNRTKSTRSLRSCRAEKQNVMHGHRQLPPELDPLSSPFFLTKNFSPTAKEHSWQLLTITFTIVNFTELGFTLSALSDISPVYSCLIFRQPHNLFDLNALFQRWPCLKPDVRLLKCSNSKRSIVLDWQNFGVSSILFDYRSQSND